jgi:hypothetical protein
MLRNLLVLFMLLFVSQVILAQSKNGCSTALNYENKNQVDPKPLRLPSVSGAVEDEQGVYIPDVCLGIFTEDGQKLVMQATSDENGRFAFSSLPAGKYRLVAKYSPFCTANIPIEVVTKNQKGNSKRKKVVVHMKPSGIDSCSYGDYK